MQDTKVLHPNRLKLTLYLVACSFFAVLGGVMIERGAQGGWLVAICFSCATFVFAVSMLPRASYLKLDADGFETCSLFRKDRLAWSEVERFFEGRMAHQSFVFYMFGEAHDRAAMGKKLARAVSPGEGMLPDTYGLRATKLAELMNEYKRAHDQETLRS